MAEARSSPSRALALLCAASFLTIVVISILGPLLVDLAEEFDTSVAVAGQLGAVIFITWGGCAPLVGPVSDTYGRRLVALTGLMLMAVGILGSGLAWSYGSLMAMRLLTGVGGSMTIPNSIAAITDIYPPERRGRAVGWLLSLNGLGSVLGVPMVAVLAGIGGWRLPFFVLGAALLVVWSLLWVWFPRTPPQPGRSLDFFSRYKEVGGSPVYWYALVSNTLKVTAGIGASVYFAAYLIRTYDLKTEETALPLALMGVGSVLGGFFGGRVAEGPNRMRWVFLSMLSGGTFIGLVFNLDITVWSTVGIAFGGAFMFIVSGPFIAILMAEMGGGSRATATGFLAMSNQLGGLAGASIGGLMLSLGGFSFVGIFFASMGAASVVVLLPKVRELAQPRGRMATRKSGSEA